MTINQRFVPTPQRPHDLMAEFASIKLRHYDIALNHTECYHSNGRAIPKNFILSHNFSPELSEVPKKLKSLRPFGVS
jgi:hypothetical protein